MGYPYTYNWFISTLNLQESWYHDLQASVELAALVAACCLWEATEEPELLGHEIENWAACLGGSTVSGREEVCSMEVMRKKTTLGSWPVSLEPTSLKQIPVPNSTWHDSPQRPDQPATNLNAEPSRNPKL